MTQNSLFPWVNIFRLAIAHGIAPDAAWHMTPNVIFKLLDIGDAQGHMSRHDLAALAARYPDKPTSQNFSY